ncbi:MAG: DUF58 domain-containing protein [Chitinivibrionales bacterium]|nr:DUF58 domain-containing protein [Chitinivibrionales bacterium]
MIVPTNRLLIFIAAICIPAMTMAGITPILSVCSLTVLSSAGILLILDLLLSWQMKERVTVEFQPVYRIIQAEKSCLTVVIANKNRRMIRLSLGVAFPESVTTENYTMHCSVPAGADQYGLDWTVIGATRGIYSLNQCRAQVGSRLGFFGMRKPCMQKSEIRIYPNLRNEYRQVASFLHHSGMTGVHCVKHLGKGREFEKLREYVHGDCFDDIHWKTTAKRYKPVTKVFQIEKTQSLYISIDTSRTSARIVGHGHQKTDEFSQPLVPATVLEHSIASSLILANIAQRQGDLYGLITFNNKNERFLKASTGNSHYAAFRDALFTIQPEHVNPNFHEVMAYIKTKINRRSLVIFLTNLSDPVLGEEFIESVALIARKHLVMVCIPLYNHARPLFSEPVSTLEQMHDHLSRHIMWSSLSQMGKKLKTIGVRLMQVEPHKLSRHLVEAYRATKQRQLL